MNILRHINNELLLALWLLQQMAKEQKECVVLEHNVLCRLFNQSRISGQKINAFSSTIEPIFPCVKTRKDWHGRTVLYLYPTDEGIGVKSKSISELPQQQEAEEAIGIRWKKVIIDEYTPNRKEAHNLYKENFRFHC